jgi:hypothetical protein
MKKTIRWTLWLLAVAGMYETAAKAQPIAQTNHEALAPLNHTQVLPALTLSCDGTDGGPGACGAGTGIGHLL